MMYVRMMRTFDPDAYIYDGGPLSVTEEQKKKKKKDWNRGTMRLGCMYPGRMYPGYMYP